MPQEYQRDGDNGFIGLNSRDNPASLPAGMVSKSQNFRLDRGIATVRNGIRRLTSTNILNKTIYGIGTYINGDGQEIFVIVVTNGVHTFNPETEVFSTLISFPSGETITTKVGCDVVTTTGTTVNTAFIFISRGHSKRPLKCTIDTTTYLITGIVAMPTSGTGAEFPNCSGLLYYCNRLIAIGQHHSKGYTPTARSRDSVCVSNYLDFEHWDALDVYTFNEGSNDEVIAVAPWTLTEFVVFLRNSIFYVNVGTTRYANSDPLTASTALMKSLVTDIGCKAKNSVVLAGGGIIFLSDNGIYIMNPTQVGSNESIRLLTSSEPLSAPIDDVIQRINKSYIQNSVGVYWNNRYYLSVPLDDSVDNNCILVYNFLIKNWESVDTYPAGFDAIEFAVGKKSNQRRLFSFDTDQGVFLLEELDYDEYGASTGKPILPFPSDPPLILAESSSQNVIILNTASFTPNQINGELNTRLYTYNQLKDKRFSTAEIDLVSNGGSYIETYADTINQDTASLIDSFGFSQDEDSTRRIAIRKIAYGLKLRFLNKTLRTSIRGVSITSTIMGKQNISKK
ncbi:hypothetical protein UFOVP157_7 [uncultured Caudovirales phage]|uniref:Uncharacterized protein n=1 Tax=uncultured Caudovirales phage TaxID=2100421 RepID=A0A6J7WCC8_9CAUD|nr:hypothetical protein UFOVP157_7 [uncultured Caudovirales phage]